MARSQCQCQSFLVDNAAARGIDQDGARFHGLDGIAIDEVFGARDAGNVQADDIGSLQEVDKVRMIGLPAARLGHPRADGDQRP